jgi:hypothetical protein
VIDALASLVAKSTVTMERDGATTRYRLLETLRHFARERSDGEEAVDVLRRRHAAHCADLAAQIAQDCWGLPNWSGADGSPRTSTTSGRPRRGPSDHPRSRTSPWVYGFSVGSSSSATCSPRGASRRGGTWRCRTLRSWRAASEGSSWSPSRTTHGSVGPSTGPTNSGRACSGSGRPQRKRSPPRSSQRATALRARASRPGGWRYWTRRAVGCSRTALQTGSPA